MSLPDSLLERLEQSGWAVTRRKDDLPWWAHEVWTLESQWSPHGFTLFLTFLTDPQPGNPNPFCEVGTCRTFPENRSEAAGEPVLMMTPRWVEELPPFVAALGALRQAGPRTGPGRQAAD
jgi:hypothetical protein